LQLFAQAAPKWGSVGQSWGARVAAEFSLGLLQATLSSMQIGGSATDQMFQALEQFRKAWPKQGWSWDYRFNMIASLWLSPRFTITEPIREHLSMSVKRANRSEAFELTNASTRDRLSGGWFRLACGGLGEMRLPSRYVLV
jgi:hypothetical protein